MQIQESPGRSGTKFLLPMNDHRAPRRTGATRLIRALRIYVHCGVQHQAAVENSSTGFHVLKSIEFFIEVIETRSSGMPRCQGTGYLNSIIVPSHHCAAVCAGSGRSTSCAVSPPWTTLKKFCSSENFSRSNEYSSRRNLRLVVTLLPSTALVTSYPA